MNLTHTPPDWSAIADCTQHDSRLFCHTPTLAHATVTVAEAWVFKDAHQQSARQTQYTFGEPLRITAIENDWRHAQSLRDGYCGWIQTTQLQQHAPSAPASHSTRYTAPVTTQADLKSEPVCLLPPDSLFTPDQHTDAYYHIPNLGWVHQMHVLAHTTHIDPCTSAEEFLNKSYLWGGRSIAGLDCSALSQLCYRRAGRTIPRDADLQAHYLQQCHQTIQANQLRRGDLLFVPGHVMLAYDADHIIHASGHHMRVVKEHTTRALARYRQSLGTRYTLKCYRWIDTPLP